MADGAAIDNQYFALKTGDEFVAEARRCERNWLYTAQERGIWRLWLLIYCQVLGIDPATGDQNVNQQLRFVGEQAQYAMFRIQLTRGYIQQRVMTAQDQRPSFTGVATNNDVASLAQVNTASKAIDYVLSEAGLEKQASAALESNGYFGAGYLHLRWDYDGGEYVDVEEQASDPQTGELLTDPVLDDLGNPVPEIDPGTGEPGFDLHPGTGEVIPRFQRQPVIVQRKRKSGSPKISRLYPWQCIVDPYREDDHPWVIVKEPVNKHELAAQFPEHADKIRALTLDYELGDDALFAWGGRNAASTDTIVLRTFYHRASTALPQGRSVGYVGDVCLWGGDGKMPCPLEQGLPVEEIIAGRYFSTAFGYPEAGDLLSLQTVLNEIVSQAITNLQKFGNPNVYKREDLQLDERAFQEGGKVIDLPPNAEPPVVPQYAAMPEIAKFMLDFVEQQLMRVAQTNPTAMGTPEPGVTSGSFALLLVNIAQKFASQIQQAYDFALTGIANKALEMMRKNAPNGFYAEMAGISDTPYLEYISGQDIAGIRRVKIIRQNPAMSTIQARMEILRETIELPKDQRQDALEFLLNSRIDSYAENDQSAALRIRKENEKMLRGIKCVVSVTDDHKIHALKHRMQLDKLLTQDEPDPQLVQLLEDHIVEHANTWASCPAPLLEIVGNPIPTAMMSTGAPPSPDMTDTGAPSGSGTPPGPVAGPNLPRPPQPPKHPAGANQDIGTQV